VASFTLLPAYGRDYKNKTDARSDFESGKDFQDSSYGATRPYINAEQIPDGASVKIRFLRATREFSFEKGTKPPAPHLTKTPRAPRPTGYRVLGWVDPYEDEEPGVKRRRIGVDFTSKAKAVAQARKFAGFPHYHATVVIALWGDARTEQVAVYGTPHGRRVAGLS
jgi:hypothetical protein